MGLSYRRRHSFNKNHPFLPYAKKLGYNSTLAKEVLQELGPDTAINDLLAATIRSFDKRKLKRKKESSPATSKDNESCPFYMKRADSFLDHINHPGQEAVKAALKHSAHPKPYVEARKIQICYSKNSLCHISPSRPQSTVLNSSRESTNDNLDPQESSHDKPTVTEPQNQAMGCDKESSTTTKSSPIKLFCGISKTSLQQYEELITAIDNFKGSNLPDLLLPYDDGNQSECVDSDVKNQPKRRLRYLSFTSPRVSPYRPSGFSPTIRRPIRIDILYK